MFGREPIPRRGHDDAESLHVATAQRVVLLRAAEQVTAAVDPQQRRGGRRRRGGPVQPRPGAGGQVHHVYAVVAGPVAHGQPTQ